VTSELAPEPVEAGTEPDFTVLENPMWESLNGAHAYLALGTGHARRYPDDVAVFVGLSYDESGLVWTDLQALVGSGTTVAVTGVRASVPDDWKVDALGQGVQMISTDRFETWVDPEVVRLGADDAEEMVALVERTKPGPFRPRTHVLGNYFGIRQEGKLVAMAGERLHPPGWTEISAVCTDEEYRGRGYGTKLVRAVGAGIRARGEIPFLHASATNYNAIRLYQALGFEIRREITFLVVEVP
jgi:ribosomal protein S18 acetylase RimI-like enzyme